MTWREKWRQDPDLAESIIEALRQDLKDAEKRIEMLQFALERIAEASGCRECGGETQAEIALKALK
jgi:hypothetical protein